VTTVGVIGIGDMGMPILGSYVRGGHDVLAFDLRDEALAEAERRGARRAASASELAAASDVVAVVLVDDSQLRAVLPGPDGVLAAMRAGTHLIVHTTALPETVTQLAAAAADYGVALVDSPVTGGTQAAEAGKLTLLVGGPDATVAAVRPVLSAIGSIQHVGPAGAGQVMKLANNLMHFGNKAFLYQALQLTGAFGIDEKRAREVFELGTGDSWALRNLDHLDNLRRTHTISGTPQFFEFMSKDVWTAAVVARSVHLHLPLTAALSESLPALEAWRMAERDSPSKP
jgi:3-hydroxyisobutyrate dehydrogenase